jgi:ribosome-associated protein
MTAKLPLYDFDAHHDAKTTPDEAPAFRPPSKTQRKKEQHALQALGDNILKYLPPRRLAALPIPEELLDALQLARSIKEREAKRRQSQYIGRLMRTLEPEQVDALQRILEPFMVHKYRASLPHPSRKR